MFASLGGFAQKVRISSGFLCKLRTKPYSGTNWVVQVPGFVCLISSLRCWCCAMNQAGRPVYRRRPASPLGRRCQTCLAAAVAMCPASVVTNVFTPVSAESSEYAPSVVADLGEMITAADV